MSESSQIPVDKRFIIRRLISGAVFMGCALLWLLWMVFVDAPPPEEVCAHKMQLVSQETENGTERAAQQLLDKLSKVCVKNAERRIRLRNKINYAEYARCVMAAEKLADAERC